MGIGYQDLNYYSKEVLVDGQVGKIYTNIQLMGRLDLPTRITYFVQTDNLLQHLRLLQEGQALLHKNDKPSFNSKTERFAKFIVSLPFLTNRRADFSFGYGNLVDHYFQTNAIDFDNDRSDKSTYNLIGGGIGLYGSTLDSKQYATRGYAERLIAQVFTGKEF